MAEYGPGELEAEQRDDYVNLADELNDVDAPAWNEADWDPRAVASARLYAEREGLRFPPGLGDYDTWYLNHYGS